MNVLHLFAGAGGGVLADKLLGFRSVGYVEIDPYCQAVLKKRIEDGCIDAAPIFGDVGDFLRDYASRYWEIADVVAGGFPCQPFSVAGKRKGSADNRNLWPEFAEVVRQVRPRYVFAENVPGLLSWDGGRYFGKIVGDLAEMGFDVRWCVLGASDVGAPHRRKRLWILADSRCECGDGLQPVCQCGKSEASAAGCGSEDLADSDGWGLSERSECDSGPTESREQTSLGYNPGGRNAVTWWDTDPADLPNTDRGRGDSRSGVELVVSDEAEDGREGSDLPDTERQRCGRGGKPESGGEQGPSGELANGHCGEGWTEANGEVTGSTQPRLGRVAHGMAHRVDRLRAIGNGQVPLVAATAWCILKGEP